MHTTSEQHRDHADVEPNGLAAMIGLHTYAETHFRHTTQCVEAPIPGCHCDPFARVHADLDALDAGIGSDIVVALGFGAANRVAMLNDRRDRQRRIHDLVLEAFGEESPCRECRRRDGDG